MNHPSAGPAEKIESLAETHIADCYQCGKCSAGCPVAQNMDMLPNQLMRLVQLGRVDKAIASGAIWQCVSCWTCTTRCPKEVNCAGVMDALRQIAFEEKLAPREYFRTVAFQKAFLDNIRRNGRLNEVELIGEFKTRAFLSDGNMKLLMKDALLAPKLMKRGKFHLVGEKAKDRKLVGRIFERCMTTEANANGQH